MRIASFIPVPGLTIAGFAILTAGCASIAQPIVKSALAGPTVIGEVALVDEEQKFILIDLASNLYVPPPGAALRAINSQGETAHLRTSPERKRPFVAADIVDGTPAVGDQVVR